MSACPSSLSSAAIDRNELSERRATAPRSPVLALHESALHRQLHGRQAEGFPCHRLGHAVNLEHDPAGLHLGGPILDRALALAHTHLGRLLRDRDVGEDAYPDPALTLHVAGHGATRRLDLAGGDAFRLHGLEAVGPEVEVESALGLAVDAALV